jgi:hypothetical protein
MCLRAWLLGWDEQRLHQANGSKNLRPQRRATLIDYAKSSDQFCIGLDERAFGQIG